ncbi:MAG TPA: Nramp family divalent metal transporter [Candidatus Polarisedimenticolia bacterium]|jgi:manganese transport protein|nr:Nramp family divalent metal transporter [Candidatus Polarisedimenticolia bacterium]
MRTGVETLRQRSLDEVHSSVAVDQPSTWRRLFAFAGPAYLVSVGYMDPGNWATDLEGGARFGYELCWVLLMSNAMAVLLQTLAARMGLASGMDLAQASRASTERPVGFVLWILCEVAIAACDLAEVLGTIIGLNLLFGIPMLWGCLITLCDTFMLLAIQRLGIRKMEAFILLLVLTIGGCFLLEIFLSNPQWGQVFKGFIPRLQSSTPYVFSHPEALFVAIGILGATVMPHNLYLHSALVQSRRVKRTPEAIRRACRYNLVDTAVALNAALFVNAAILIVAAATFNRRGIVVTEIQQAHELLTPLLGTAFASTAFGIALLCSGQSSTLTGTLAGQVVMEGFLQIRLKPWVRRLITRSIAIVPAVVVILIHGEGGTYKLLIVSQVILSLQLPFAIIPLIQVTSDRKRMGEFVSPPWVKILAWIAATIIIALNAKLIYDLIADWVALPPPASTLTWSLVVPLVGACTLLLGWIILRPFLPARKVEAVPVILEASEVLSGLVAPSVKRAGLALDRSVNDKGVLSYGLGLARDRDTTLILIHVVEGVGAQVYGEEVGDRETREASRYLDSICADLVARGYKARTVLGYGVPSVALVEIAKEYHIDLLVLGGHGHRLFADMMKGQTISSVRHAVTIPVVTIRQPGGPIPSGTLPPPSS